MVMENAEPAVITVEKAIVMAKIFAFFGLIMFIGISSFGDYSLMRIIIIPFRVADER
jgi:hypothetical protein